MKKYLALCLLALLFSNSIQADERSLSQKQKAAATVLNRTSNRKNLDKAKEIVPLQTMNELTVMGYENGEGFAIIANDDSFAPALGYSYTKFTSKDMPDGLKWWMKAMNTALEDKVSSTNTLNIQKIIDENGFAQSISALLTAEWGQEYPFYMKCPISATSAYPCVTGCVATAMAQIMQYYKCPGRGVGSYSYETTLDGQPVTLSADLSNTAYNWNLMPDNYDYPTEEQIAQVAQLMYHCGVTVNTEYSTVESVAFIEDAIRAMSENFNYSKNIQVRYRKKYSINDWIFLVMRELNAGRPILYAGRTSSNSAHAFVVDGYDEEGLVHVNWGWTGRYNGMYDISLLNPAGKQYSEAQSMIIGIAPKDKENIPYYAELYIYESSLEVSLSSYLNLGSTIRMYNGSENTEHGTLAILLEGENGYLHEWTSKHTEEEGLAPWDDLLLTSTMYLPIPDNLPDGTYHVYAAFRRDGETEWIRPRYDTDKINECVLTKHGNEYTAKGITAYIGLEKDPTVTSLQQQVLSPEKTFDGKVYVYDFYGRCIYTTDASSFEKKDIPGNGFFLIKRGSQTEKIWKDN